jgi:hypothetical protein
MRFVISTAEKLLLWAAGLLHLMVQENSNMYFRNVDGRLKDYSGLQCAHDLIHVAMKHKIGDTKLLRYTSDGRKNVDMYTDWVLTD